MPLNIANQIMHLNNDYSKTDSLNFKPEIPCKRLPCDLVGLKMCGYREKKIVNKNVWSDKNTILLIFNLNSTIIQDKTSHHYQHITIMNGPQYNVMVLPQDCH